MDLDLAPVRTQGRPAKPVEAEVVRQLNAADLVLLDLPRGVAAPTLKKLKDSHHSIARLVAQGLSGIEIASITGYSQSRISILKGDPSFAELVSFYKGRLEELTDEVLSDGAAKLAAVRNDVIEELHDRLSDSPETFSNEDLLDTLKATADRTGLGPQSKSTNLNVNIDLADRIAAGRARVAKLVPASIPPLQAEGGEPVVPTGLPATSSGVDE